METVVLLPKLKQKPDDYINVTIELDDVDITSAETKATNDEIKRGAYAMPGILVVEDDENLNRGITFSLKKSGYEVFSAESVKKAKRIASDHNVDVTICDVNLPDGHVGEQVEVLEHHAHLLAQLVDVGLGVGDLMAVEGNGAGSGDLQQVQTPQEGGLAGAGGADDDHLFPGVDVLGQIVQHQMVPEGFAEVFNVDHFDAASCPACPAARRTP